MTNSEIHFLFLSILAILILSCLIAWIYIHRKHKKIERYENFKKTYIKYFERIKSGNTLNVRYMLDVIIGYITRNTYEIYFYKEGAEATKNLILKHLKEHYEHEEEKRLHKFNKRGEEVYNEFKSRN